MVYVYNDIEEPMEGDSGHMQILWAVMGDFNIVMHKEDKIRSHVTVAGIRDFRQCVDACSFQELKSTLPIIPGTTNKVEETEHLVK